MGRRPRPAPAGFAERGRGVTRATTGRSYNPTLHSRHPGLDPGSRFTRWGRRSGTPAQGRGDGSSIGRPLIASPDHTLRD
ncbi:MAG: hypothetical protein EKK50_07520 [Sphingomonadaceae bacterium]|nr:MAG: hypothetical protein EKK50_07520 [Sphingomonadaceae bacterium]